MTVQYKSLILVLMKSTYSQTGTPSEALNHAIQVAGSQTVFADKLNKAIDELGLHEKGLPKVGQNTVSKWTTRDGRISPRYAAVCEYAFSQHIPKHSLRPDMFWPERDTDA